MEIFSGIKSGLYVPMKTGEITIGVISVESEKADAFDENDERLLTTLASQAAAADPERPPIRQTQRRAMESAVLSEVTGELAALKRRSGIAANHRKTASQESWMYGRVPFTFMMPHTRNSRLWPAHRPDQPP